MSQVVIVTGGAGGIGSTICRGLVDDGNQLMIADFDVESASRLARELGERALPVQVDVSNKESVDHMVHCTLDHFGKIDVLLNGAGIMPRHQVKDITEDEWDRAVIILAVRSNESPLLGPPLPLPQTGRLLKSECELQHAQVVAISPDDL